MRRGQARTTLRPVDRLYPRVPPRGFIVGNRPAPADLVPSGRIRGRQRLRAEGADYERFEMGDVLPRAPGPAERQMEIDVSRCGDRRSGRVQALEGRLEILVDRVVLAHCVDISEVEVRGEPWRFVVRDPHDDGWMVLQHRDHLRLLLLLRFLEDTDLHW